MPFLANLPSVHSSQRQGVMLKNVDSADTANYAVSCRICIRQDFHVSSAVCAIVLLLRIQDFVPKTIHSWVRLGIAIPGSLIPGLSSSQSRDIGIEQLYAKLVGKW